MESYALIVGLTVLSVAFSLAYRGIRSRVRKGRYEEGRSAAGPSFTTDEGTFVVSAGRRCVDIMVSGQTFHLPFDDVESLQLEERSREAMMEEMLFEGFSLFDLRRKYRDLVHTYRIVIRTRTRGEVPLYECAQYEVRDFLDFSTPVQLWLLGLMGLHRKADEVAAEVLQKIQLQMSRAGLPVRTTRW